MLDNGEPPPHFFHAQGGNIEGTEEEYDHDHNQGQGEVSGPEQSSHFDLHILNRHFPEYTYSTCPCEEAIAAFTPPSPEPDLGNPPICFRRYLGKPLNGEKVPQAVFWVMDLTALLSHVALLEALFSLEVSLSTQEHLGVLAIRATGNHLLLKVNALGEYHRDHSVVPGGELPPIHADLKALLAEAASCYPELVQALLSLGIHFGYNVYQDELELVVDVPLMDHRSNIYSCLWASLREVGEESEHDLQLLGITTALSSLGGISLEVEAQIVKALTVTHPPISTPPRELRTLARLLKGRISDKDIRSLLLERFPTLLSTPTGRGGGRQGGGDVVVWVACRHPPSRCSPETSRHAVKSHRSLLEELPFFQREVFGRKRRGPWEVDLTALDGDAVERALDFLEDGLLLGDVALGASGPQSIGHLMEVAHWWGATDLMAVCCHAVEERVKSLACSSSSSSPSAAGGLIIRRDMSLAVLQLFDMLTVAGVDCSGRNTCLDFIMANYHDCCKACEPDCPSLPLPLALQSKRKGRGLSLDHFSASPLALAIINHRRLHHGFLPEPERVPDKCPSLARILEEDLSDLRARPIPGVEILSPSLSSGQLSSRLLPAPFLVRLCGPALEGTPWGGGRHELLAKFRISTAYPRESPRVSFIIVKVLHPNIDPTKGLLFPEALDHMEGREGSPCLPSLRVVLEYLVGPTGLLANPTIAPDRVVDPEATELVYMREDGGASWVEEARRVAEEGRRETVEGLRRRMGEMEGKGQMLLPCERQVMGEVLRLGTALDLYRGVKMLEKVEMRWDLEEEEWEGGRGRLHEEEQEGKRRRMADTTISTTTTTTTSGGGIVKRRPPAGPGQSTRSGLRSSLPIGGS